TVAIAAEGVEKELAGGVGEGWTCCRGDSVDRSEEIVQEVTALRAGGEVDFEALLLLWQQGTFQVLGEPLVHLAAGNGSRIGRMGHRQTVGSSGSSHGPSHHRRLALESHGVLPERSPSRRHYRTRPRAFTARLNLL